MRDDSATGWSENDSADFLAFGDHFVPRRAEKGSADECGDAMGLDRFGAERWNLFALDQPDPEDRPAALAEQLAWLHQAGLVQADVYWMYAGHAVFGARAAGSLGPQGDRRVDPGQAARR